MAQVGEKRPPEHQIPDDSEGDASKGGGGGPSSNSPSVTSPAAKRPALPSSTFMFRPSPLQQATQGFTLRQPTLKSPASTFGSNKSPSAAKPPTPMQGGFLKLSSDGLKPIAIHSPPGPLMGGAMGGMTTPTTSQNSSPGSGAVINNDSKRDNPFLQFVANASTSGHSFSSLSSTGPANSSFSQPRSLDQQHQASTAAVITSSLSEEDVSSQASPLDTTNQSGESIGNSSFGEEPGTNAGGSGSGVATTLTIGQQKATAILPEVHPVTGEEGEKKIVQVPARLYAFDLDTHTWKERGRGEIRLNDAAQSEGLFQSRLVMRASGSYRLLLNTHLWAQMKCDRANQKSIRITAQTGTDGKISVFLIMGAGKDIQQLFTAIDRRIEALKRNASTSQEGGEEGTKLTTPKSSSQNASFDEEDKESILDHQSSPESSPEPPDSSTRTRLIPVPILTTSPSPATQATPTITMVTTTTPTSGNPVITSQITTTSPPTRTSEGHLYHHEENRSGHGAMAIEPRSQEALLLRRSSSTSDKDSESTPNPPSSERSPSCEASTTTTISSSDNALESS